MADESARPMTEFELELKRGSPAVLFTLASSLDCAKNLKIGAPANFALGPALARGDEPTSFKATPIALKPNMPAAEAFRIIARACIQHFRLNKLLLIASRSAEPLHQARVAIRRLRSALSLFEPIVTDQKNKRLKRRLRDLSHKLGEARNLDVYIAHTKGPNARENGSLPQFALDPAWRVETERERAYERVFNTLLSKRFGHFMQDLVAWIESGPWCAREPERQAARDQTIENFAARVLEHDWRKLRRHGRHLELLCPEERHRIRIAAKKLRYASEFFSGLSTDRKQRKLHKTFIAMLEDIQAALGDLNDIQTGHEIAITLASPKAVPPSGSKVVRGAAGQRGEHNQRATALLSAACEAHRQLSGAKPFWKKLN